MLVKDTLIANDALKGLTDEQIVAIETLSRNDEDAVIGARFGEVYRQMDTTIEKALGIKRVGDEKTYNYLERASKEFATKFNDYDALKEKISTLEAELAKGGDDAIKAQLANTQAELASAKEQFNALKTSFDTEKANHVKALLDYKIDSEIARAKEGLKFKGGLNEAVMNTLVAQAIANIKAKNPTFEDRDGVSTLVFHDANNQPLLNAENALNPFSAKELLTKEFEAMDILEKAHAKGAGANPKVTSKTLGGATNQNEAIEMINKMLSEKGVAKTSMSYQDEFDKLYKEFEVSKLPLK